MKKQILTIAIILSFGFTTFAGLDGGGLFMRGENREYNGMRDNPTPMLPSHGQTGNQNAPLGTGIALLAFLSTGYLINKRSKKE